MPTPSTDSKRTYTIRRAIPSDAHALPAIERSAGTIFRIYAAETSDPDLALLADDEPTSAAEHSAHITSESGRVWVAVAQAAGDEHAAETVAGFIACRIVQIVRSMSVSTLVWREGEGRVFVHIDEVSVDAEHQRRGLAGRLVRAVIDEARLLDGCVGVSLTTMRDVSFNRGFYERAGFRVVDEGARPEEVERAIGEVFGGEGVGIWKNDLRVFAAKGGGGLAGRRCWMRYLF